MIDIDTILAGIAFTLLGVGVGWATRRTWDKRRAPRGRARLGTWLSSSRSVERIP